MRHHVRISLILLSCHNCCTRRRHSYTSHHLHPYTIYPSIFLSSSTNLPIYLPCLSSHLQGLPTYLPCLHNTDIHLPTSAYTAKYYYLPIYEPSYLPLIPSTGLPTYLPCLHNTDIHLPTSAYTAKYYYLLSSNLRAYIPTYHPIYTSTYLSTLPL